MNDKNDIYIDELKKLLKHKNTLSAIEVISEEFVRCFPQSFRKKEFIAKHLRKGQGYISWARLDVNITDLSRYLYLFYQGLNKQMTLSGKETTDTKQLQENILLFFDNFRIAIKEIQHKYRKNTKYQDIPCQFIKEYSFTFCHHCWRFTLHRNNFKSKSFCFLHDFPSIHKEYKKRERMIKDVIILSDKLQDMIPKPYQINEEFDNPASFYVNLFRKDNVYFPYLTKFIKNNGIWETPKELLYLIEGYNKNTYLSKISREEQREWDNLFDYYSINFDLNYEKLLLAEAWLCVEANKKHGGKRR